jgi:Cu(I)/Ag(I) efflux system protein CusF
MSTIRIVAAVSLAAGCGEALPEAQPTDAAAVEAAGQSGKGTGTIAAVDAAAGTVTIEHGAMPELGWPAMTMAFAADPAVLAGVAEGDKVAFDLTLTGGRGTITALVVE